MLLVAFLVETLVDRRHRQAAGQDPMFPCHNLMLVAINVWRARNLSERAIAAPLKKATRRAG